MKSLVKNIARLLSLLAIIGIGTSIAHAVDTTYTPLAPLPLGEGATPLTTYTFSTYLSGMLKLLIAVGAGIAILTAITGGVQYIAAGINPSAKGDAKDRIQNSFIGLGLILSSYLILNTINPKLVDFNLMVPRVGLPPKAPAPGVTVTPGAPVVPAEPTAPTAPTVDSAIEQLNLAPTAKSAAYELKSKYPNVVFTSGFRSMQDQARAMSQNVANNRRWIEQTYRNTTARAKLQAWVDANPTKTTASQIEAGLFSVMQQMPLEEAAGISKHLSGSAFDIQPVSGTEGSQIKQAIQTLPGLTLFLQEEGGLTRWHAQF